MSFDWNRVAWGRPDSPPRPFCAYCSAFLPKDSVPLMLWREDGSAARFCDRCAELVMAQRDPRIKGKAK
jgi:hypothetical protein